MKPIKILLLIAAWKREKLARICYEGVNRLINYDPERFDIRPWIIVSNAEDRAIATAFGFETCYAKNEPLGSKLNAGLNKAMALSFDYLMQLGSDDLIMNELLEIYWDYFQREVPFFGVNRMYVYHITRHEMKEWTGTDVMGGARCISRQYLENTMTMNGGKLWDDDKHSGLDSSSERAILDRYGAHKGRPINVWAERPYMIDIKGHGNINQFDYLAPPFARRCTRQKMERVLPDFPELYRYIHSTLAKV